LPQLEHVTVNISRGPRDPPPPPLEYPPPPYPPPASLEYPPPAPYPPPASFRAAFLLERQDGHRRGSVKPRDA
jgi:hypothetical protein